MRYLLGFNDEIDNSMNFEPSPLSCSWFPEAVRMLRSKELRTQEACGRRVALNIADLTTVKKLNLF